MEKKCVSVIVPVYNCIRYIENCIKSIMRQTYKNLEIILVDDGSMDGSAQVCDQFAGKDDRIKVYHLKNKGVSATRNYALARATGTYIQFVDSDDYIKRDMTRTLVETIEKSCADMAVCNYTKIFRHIRIGNRALDKKGAYTGTEYLINTLKDAGHHYYGVVWNKLYRRDIISNNRICFRTDLSLGEDFVFNLDYWKRCKSVCVTSKKLYLYNKDQNLTLSSNSHKRLKDCRTELECRRIIYKEYESAFKQIGLYEQYREQICFYWIVFLVRQMRGLISEYYYWSEDEQQTWYRELLHDRLIQESRRNVRKIRAVCYDWRYSVEYELKAALKKIFRIRCKRL